MERDQEVALVMNLKQWEVGGKIEWEPLGALSCLQLEEWGGLGLSVLPGDVRALHELCGELWWLVQ